LVYAGLSGVERMRIWLRTRIRSLHQRAGAPRSLASNGSIAFIRRASPLRM
jgi:hypothetical protein